MKTNFLFILFFCSFSLKAQTDCDCYERLINLSEYYTLTKQDKLALKTVKKALEFKEKESWHKDDYLLLALKYAQVRDFSKTKENLVESMCLGINLSHLQTNHMLNEFSKTHFWNELLVEAPLLAEKFKEKRNVEVISQHSKISTILFPFSFNYEPPLNPKTFKPRFIVIKEVVEKYGFPDPKENNYLNKKLLFILYQYAMTCSKKDYKEILKMLMKAQSNCNVTKKNIASIIENKIHLPHQSLPFGSFRLLTKYDFINTKHIDKRRFEYNLLRLSEDAEMKNKELPAKYKKRNYPKNYFCGYRFSN